MKHFLAGAVCVSFAATVAAFMLPTPKPKVTHANLPQISNPKINLSDYSKQKFRSEKRQTNFAQILNAPAILGVEDEASSSESSSTNTSTNSAQIAKNTNLTLSGANIKIVLLGDSMVDTLGKDLPHLRKLLAQRYPGISFELYNYGAGATNIESGIDRLTNASSYLGEGRRPIVELKPEIVVVESFAYNHWSDSQSDMDRHWLAMAKIKDILAGTSSRVIFASTIAPYCPTYTDGSANLPPERKYSQCATVKKYLQNTINFARDQGFYLADAYNPSLKGADGNPIYINQGDHIHPSDAGRLLFSQKVVEQIARIIR